MTFKRPFQTKLSDDSMSHHRNVVQGGMQSLHGDELDWSTFSPKEETVICISLI